MVSLKYGSGVFRVRVNYVSGVFWFYGFRINPTGLERLLLGYFVFCLNKMHDYLKIQNTCDCYSGTIKNMKILLHSYE